MFYDDKEDTDTLDSFRRLNILAELGRFTRQCLGYSFSWMGGNDSDKVDRVFDEYKEIRNMVHEYDNPKDIKDWDMMFTLRKILKNKR